jgi:hypothetical protein
VNRHTGEQRTGSLFADVPVPRDLDDPDLSQLPAGTLAAHGSTRVIARPGGRLELRARGHPTRTLTRRCPGACRPVALDGAHVAWVQKLGHGRRARWTVRRAPVPSARVTTWRLPGQRCAPSDSPAAMFAAGGLYVSGCRTGATGRRPLYHAL